MQERTPVILAYWLTGAVRGDACSGNSAAAKRLHASGSQWRKIILSLLLLLTLGSPAALAQLGRNSQEVWPSVDAYLRL
ncbi:MAG: hypothetical protein MUF29_08200, partial [Chitinophagaceae bacterium]|nr:hypothetical protein [Chitinophagaceae bacterium]